MFYTQLFKTGSVLLLLPFFTPYKDSGDGRVVTQQLYSSALEVWFYTQLIKTGSVLLLLPFFTPYKDSGDGRVVAHQLYSSALEVWYALMVTIFPYLLFVIIVPYFGHENGSHLLSQTHLYTSPTNM